MTLIQALLLSQAVSGEAVSSVVLKEGDPRPYHTSLASRKLPVGEIIERGVFVGDLFMGFPSGAVGKESACQCMRCKRCGFSPWVRKIPCRREWQPTPVFLSGKFHGQRSLAGYSSGGCRDSDTTEHPLLSMEQSRQKSIAETRWPEVDAQGGSPVCLVRCLKHCRCFTAGSKDACKVNCEIQPECGEIQERPLGQVCRCRAVVRATHHSLPVVLAAHTGVKGPKLARCIWAERCIVDMVIPSELKM